jgi:hypothetical protein
MLSDASFCRALRPKRADSDFLGVHSWEPGAVWLPFGLAVSQADAAVSSRR